MILPRNFSWIDRKCKENSLLMVTVMTFIHFKSSLANLFLSHGNFIKKFSKFHYGKDVYVRQRRRLKTLNNFRNFLFALRPTLECVSPTGSSSSSSTSLLLLRLLKKLYKTSMKHFAMSWADEARGEERKKSRHFATH